MSMGLVDGGGGGVFRWFGDQIKQRISQYVDAKMHAAGEAIVARARQLAPVQTGALRASIVDFVEVNEAGGKHTLHIQVGMPYGIYQEFGTRNIPPHPFIRPAINEMGRVWGFKVAMGFATNPAHAGLLAGAGKGMKGGFAATARPFKRLTQKQIAHVEGKLIPGVKAHQRGNVKRTRMYTW